LPRWVVRLLVALLSSGRVESIYLDLAPNGQVLLFTSLVTAVTIFLFGLVPGFRATAITGTAAV
jgi:hypothetical protein